MASAYPLEIVQAERWLQTNKNLQGDQLKSAVDKQPWDESIKSLVATPSVLEMMNEKLDWTQKLGDAVVSQQAEVMDAIQRLRGKAQANNKLTSTNEQRVTVNQVQGKQVIAIEPTDPNTVYVPYYDPGVVYGDWSHPEYPPYYFPAPGYIAAGVLATGIAFGAAYALGRWATGGNYWGGGVNWRGNNIIANRPININNVGNRWQPRVEHRQGVGNRGNLRQQLNFRGSGGQRVLNPGGGRAGLGGNGPANRPAAGNRPSRGNHVAHRGGGGGAGRVSGGRGQNVAHRGGGGGGVRTGGGRGQNVAHRGGVGRVSGARGRGGTFRAAGGHGGGGMRAGGGFRGGGRGGGRRSDVRLKNDIVLLGHLANGLGFYRFSFKGSNTLYVGVMAQEVQQLKPQAVTRGRDGYLIVYYERLGLKFETYNQWVKSGAQIPDKVRIQYWQPR